MLSFHTNLLQDDPAPLDINEVGCQGRNALHTAADCGREAMVEYLIDFGADVDAVVVGTKETALHICARRGYVMVSEISAVFTDTEMKLFPADSLPGQ